MAAVAVGLLIEEHRVEIHEAWTEALGSELPGEPALEFAVGALVRELSLALRGDLPCTGGVRPDPHLRCAVLVRSAASPARVAREFKLLHRVLWVTLRATGHVVAAEERRAADEWLDEALAAALDRLERIRSRIALLERPEVVGPARNVPITSGQRPPPLPWARARATVTSPLPAPDRHH